MVDDGQPGGAPGPHGPPPDWRADRQARLVRALRAAVALLVVACVVALLLPGRAGQVAADAVAVVLVAVPLGRVAWLVARWIRRGDLRFAAVGTGLLVLAAAGAVLAVLG